MLLEILLFFSGTFIGLSLGSFAGVFLHRKGEVGILKTTGPPAIFAQSNFPGQIIYPS